MNAPYGLQDWKDYKDIYSNCRGMLSIWQPFISNSKCTLDFQALILKTDDKIISYSHAWISEQFTKTNKQEEHHHYLQIQQILPC